MNIHVDLTKLSRTMVYAEVYNMMTTLADYVGKTIKMGGMAASYFDEATEQTYYACIILDATGCCFRGLESDPADEYSAEDYPSDGEHVYVNGVFDIYQEGEFTYCTLRDAKFLYT